jgi:hypothetical protein
MASVLPLKWCHIMFAPGRKGNDRFWGKPGFSQVPLSGLIMANTLMVLSITIWIMRDQFNAIPTGRHQVDSMRIVAGHVCLSGAITPLVSRISP